LSKDRAIGGVIFAACVVIGISYTVGLFYFGNPMGGWEVEFWLIAVPVFLAFVAIMGIGAWIGWTMATTPPPKPIEEMASEIEAKAEETKTQEESED